MGCSCGGGRSSTSWSVASITGGGSASKTWQITHANGAKVVYPNNNEAKAREDLAALNADPRTAGAKLDEINPITGAVIG